MDVADLPSPRLLLHRRLRQGELIALDALAAAGYVVLVLTGSLGGPPNGPAWAVGTVLAGTAGPLVLRRVWPVPVFGIVAAVSAIALVLGLLHDPLLCAGYALYLVALTTALHHRGWTVMIVVLSAPAVLGGILIGTSIERARLAVQALLLSLFTVGGAWTLGRAVRERRAYAVRIAEQDAARAVERAVAEERLRIARELHDVVSHTLSLIGVKAAVARHVADTHPEEMRDALAVIEMAGRDALTEMRRMLGVLRTEDTAAQLQLGLKELDALTDWAAAAGVRVDLTVRGPGRIPSGLEPSVYRIVQEAVTNVVRHATPTRCMILIEATAAEVRVEVSDDGPLDRAALLGRAVHVPGPGLGLIGMRERVLLHGGAFAAGSRPEGGFTVIARIPYAPCRQIP